MTEQFIQGIASETIWTIFLVAAPCMATALVVGLLISVFQATTQINEMTLVFVPKIVAIFFTILIFSSFMLNKLMQFTTTMFTDFPGGGR